LEARDKAKIRLALSDDDDISSEENAGHPIKGSLMKAMAHLL
jgi:hypothetical protein